MSNFARLLREDRRLVLLRVLEKAPGREVNHYILREALDDIGHNISYDTVLSELEWLEEQGLVTLERLGCCCVAHLTARGLDVGMGRCHMSGVKKPVPGE